uniref:Uncharacterized protein n=1 Tax=viral metagenome TaxID=1070528 RepID=A0A6C0LGX1_9ZZZZ
MVSFQQDFLLTINKSHENYLDKINTVFDNEDLLKDLSIDDAEKLIEYIKEYKNLINSICLVIDKINNVKNLNSINTKIENELILKMIPIMNIYRTLLLEKYNKPILKKNTINDQD